MESTEHRISNQIIPNFFSLLLRQEMYIGKVQKGRLTIAQSLELYKMACTSTAVCQCLNLPTDKQTGFDNDGIPFDVPQDKRDEINALVDSYYIPVKKFYEK